MNDCYWWPQGGTPQGNGYGTECGSSHWVDHTDRKPAACPFCDGQIRVVSAKQWVPDRD